jgi:hypothetical protein
MEVDFTEESLVELPKGNVETKKVIKPTKAKVDTDVMINCLRDEKVVIRFVPRGGGLVTDPKHVLYGGMGITSKRRLVVPMLQTKVYKNILTNSEKEYLEYIMGLEPNTLSVYKKTDNYWGTAFVELGKDPLVLDLSVPDDYIKYKILLANSTIVAPSEKVLKESRKATYQFVISEQGSEISTAVEALNIKSKAYLLFGKLNEELEKLALIVEIATGRTISNIKDKNNIYAVVEKLLKEDAKAFIKAAEDPYLDTKLLIKNSINIGTVRKRGTYYYLTEGNKPLCSDKQEPLLENACAFLNAPKNQEVLFLLQTKLKD